MINVAGNLKQVMLGERWEKPAPGLSTSKGGLFEV